MKKRNVVIPSFFFTIAIIIFIISAIIDAILYFNVGFHVPSITISIMSLSSAVLCFTLKKILEES